jgi:hypothetical protein
MLFPADEYPSADTVAALATVGVTCRALPRALVEPGEEATPLRDQSLEGMSGFTLKIAAVILSSFQEVGALR